MILSARDVAKSLQLPVEDQTEVERIAKEIEPNLRPPKFDGRPVRFDLPAGQSEVERDRSLRIACALQREFQAALWLVYLETTNDAYGEPEKRVLHFAIDARAVQGPEVPRPSLASRESGGRAFSLRNLHAELSDLFGGGEPIESAPAEVTVTVVLGTHNRIEHLKAAIRSIRAATKSPYEIAVTDGGSTDGSRPYLAGQPDVLLVGERRLEGAVRAFNQAAALGRGDFVANFNDDASYSVGALDAAVAHLNAHPRCGQVAFPHSGKMQPTLGACSLYPGFVYANFGVIRRDVLDAISYIQGGFWHPVYRTYAADCEQSAWVHRLGFGVEAVASGTVRDAWAEDALREGNASAAAAEAKLMRSRWPSAAHLRPNGPEPLVCDCPGRAHRDGDLRCTLERYRAVRDGRAPVRLLRQDRDPLAAMVSLCGLPLPEDERRIRAIGRSIRALDPVEGRFPEQSDFGGERVLYVSLATDEDPQEGLRRALGQSSATLREVRWFADYRGDAAKRQGAILSAARAARPTLVFMQLQMPGAVSVETVRQIRELADPRCVIASWCGDIARENSPWNAGWQVEIGRACDLVLHSSFSHVLALRAQGVHNAGYLQIGLDEERYLPFDDAPDETNDPNRSGDRLDYDVCFLGNRYGVGDGFAATYNWKSGLPAHDARLRDEVVERLLHAFRERFGLFGRNWNSDVSEIPLASSREIYWRSRIALSISLDNKLECYTSDRLFRALGCGALLLVKRFPRMSVLGLEHKKNCLAFDTPEEAVRQAAEVVAVFDAGVGGKPPEAARAVMESHVYIRGIVSAGAALAREHHTWAVRMRELARYIEAVREARK